MLLVQIVRVPVEGIDAPRRFEAAVPPLLAKHGGHLERRLQRLDGCVEVHFVSFTSREALDGYRGDRRRREHLSLLDESQAVFELFEVNDVTGKTD